MPIYEYVCGACGDEFEAMQKFSDDPISVCSVCGASGKVERKLSLSAFQLKGGGWFKQGYGGDTAGGSTSAASTPSSSSDGGSAAAAST